MSENKAELNVEETELTPEEQKKADKKAEKERKKLEQYSKSMISRGEAYQMSKSIAAEEVGFLAEFMREPLSTNIVQTMALVDLLVAKGLITLPEFESQLEKTQEKIAKQQEAGAEDGGEKEES